MLEVNKLKFDEIKNWDDEKWIEEIMAKVPLSGEFRIDNIYLNIYEKYCDIDTSKGQPEGYQLTKAIFETAFLNKRVNIHGRIESHLSDILLDYGFINNSNPGAFVITEEGKLFKTKRTLIKYNEYKQKKEKAEERNIRFGFHFSVIGLVIGILTLITLVATLYVTYFKN